jgi:uncharacterized Zn finger protein (UPF0148 family)
MENFILTFFESVGRLDFSSIWKLLVAIYLIFWIVVLDWVWVDSGERTTNRKLRIFYVVIAAIFNVFGWIIYLIIRPNLTIEEIYWADLERRYLKYETSELGDCPRCGTQLYPGYLYCPECKYRIKIRCSNCNVYIDKGSKFCPFCGISRISVAQGQPEESLSIEQMEKQKEELKVEQAEVVETKGTKYSAARESMSAKIVGGYKIIIEGIKNIFKRKDSKKRKPVKKSKKKKNKKKR